MKTNSAFRPLKWLCVIAAAFAIVIASGGSRSWAAETGADKLMPIAGGALVEAGQKNWTLAKQELEQFATEWNKLNAPASSPASAVKEAMAQAQKALSDAEAHPDEAYQAVSRLTKATDEYVVSASGATAKKDGKKAAQTLLPYIQQSLEQASLGNWSEANAKYKQFISQWTKAESAIRGGQPQVYGTIEKQSSLVRIALQTEPVKPESVESSLNALVQTMNDYVDGKSAAVGDALGEGSVSELLVILTQAQNEASASRTDAATAQMESFVGMWPSVEGEVRTRSASIYVDVENQMTQVIGYLASKPAKTQEALKVIATMQEELRPFTEQASYSAWDAGLILLREGMEALLVVAALLAFLHRTGNGSKQKWIWGGAATGLLASALLAVVLTLTIAKAASGSARELIEGITGLVSVLLMITVGLWLHGKANVDAWNSYIQGQIGMALASGRLWYLFLIAGLAILREGAETAIFYIGMAPAIESVQLILGIAIALAILLVVGFVIVKGSVRLPVRPFFLAATVFIYYLVIKFLGQSLHSLQVAGKLAAHSRDYLLSWSWLGVYPTLETSIPQMAALLFILLLFARTALKNKASGGGRTRTA